MNIVNIWILIFSTHVHSGGVTTFQEFYGKESCLQAATLALKDAREVGHMARATCVPKGVARQ